MKSKFSTACNLFVNWNKFSQFRKVELGIEENTHSSAAYKEAYIFLQQTQIKIIYSTHKGHVMGRTSSEISLTAI